MKNLDKYLSLTEKPVKTVLSITAFATVVSVSITWLVYAVFDVDESYKSIGYSLSIGLPLVIAPSISTAILMLLRELAESYRRLEYVSKTDSLTKQLNRGHVLEIAESELSDAKEKQSHFGVHIIDFDHFKNINDTYGHEAGDEVLIQYSSVISSVVRSTDTFGRFGGEEFVVVCPETDTDTLTQIAQRIIEAVRQYTVDYEGHEIKLTVSIGTIGGKGSPDLSLKNMIKAADELLYKVKENGRDSAIIKSVDPGDDTEIDLSDLKQAS